MSETNATSRPLRDAIYEQTARIAKAVASPARLALLELLGQRPWTVEALARESGLSVANTSQHLQVLRRAHLVEAEKQGLHVTYQLAGEDVATFFASLCRLAETRLAEIERLTRDLLAGGETFEAVDRKTLVRRVRRGEVVLLDVRPEAEYRAGHLPGAISVPLPELARRLRELPRDREVVAYCRGPYCLMSVEAVALLRARGFHARRLEEGVLEWRSRGMAVAAGAR